MPSAAGRAQSEKVLSPFLEIKPEECDISVCLASVTGDAPLPSFEILQLSDKLTDEFRGIVSEVLSRCNEDFENGEVRVLPYDAGSKPERHELEYLDLGEHDGVRGQFKAISTLADLPSFRVEDSFVDGLRFYVIVAQSGKAKPLFCFRAYHRKKELGRSGLIAALFGRGTFDKMTDTVLLFDRKIHCMSRGDTMLIFNKDSFHKIFRFFEELLKTADETLSTIRARVPISNFGDFAEACKSHLQMQGKLKNIASKPYLRDLEMKDIKKVLKRVPDLGVKIVKHDGQEMLEFDPKDKWAILRLLDDDYLDSIMTGSTYEVSGKRPISS